MACNRNRNLEISAFFGLIAILLSGCGRSKLGDCAGGPLANTQKLFELQQDRFPTGPKAYLVLPNPIDSPKLKLFEFSFSTFRNAQESVGLPGLTSSVSLDNKFLKVRQHSLFDDPKLLVSPKDLSDASLDIKDPKYSQIMAYHSITAISDFVKSLGFSVDQSRPLYVMVRSNQDPLKTAYEPVSTVNAIYVHNRYETKLPRFIQIFGDVQYPLGADRDVYWHEFGHHFNESVTGDRGIDEASEQGATYSEAGAIHECLADYLAESASGKPYTGKWFTKNLPEFKPGQPVRSAVGRNDGKDNFSQVGYWNPIPSTHLNRKYLVAEWCTRVLWEVRQQFQKEDPVTGTLFSDRTIFGAVSRLKKNTSFTEFRNALLQSDSQLHCGLHENTIKNAFASRGFPEKADQLTKKLQIKAEAVGFRFSGNQAITVAPNASASEIRFKVVINNPNRATARNVRVMLVSKDPAILPLTPLQSYGDLVGGGEVTITTNDYNLLQATVGILIDKKHVQGRNRAAVTLKVIAENGSETSISMELGL